VSAATIRRASSADLPELERLWRAFEREVPPPAHIDVDPRVETRQIAEVVAGETAFVAERDGRPVAFALARRLGARGARLTDLYVEPEERRRGLAQALVREIVGALAAEGVEILDLEVMSSNADARAVYQRWGFREEMLVLAAPIHELQERLVPGRHAESFASIHVQTDDRGWVERTVRQYAPRVGSKGSRVEGPRNGWTVVYDQAADGDPNVLLRFARELSERMGAVVVALALELDAVVRLIALDRGGIVDEYLSVPEFYGPLPPGDVIGLAANATVLHRLTGADPAAVRAVARTAPSPAELPPPRELLAAIAGVLGLEGALHGYEPDG
jgi:ribosomal protein S18 acetylase RimI-like enzyme